jgi:signal peptidase I
MMLRLPLYSAIQFGVGLFVTALVIQTWLAMGLIVPVTVAGSSMAPTLVGPHQIYRCDACGDEFSIGLDQLAIDAAADCPQCGRRSAAAVAPAVRRGQRLIIDRTAYLFRAPRRWEVIVFRSPESLGELVVKRVVGLPGETVSLVDGNVWINGRIVRKPHNTVYEIRPGDRPEQGGNCWRLGSTECFVLGDNEAISDDSRSWLAGGGLDAKLLVGKPLGVR